MSNPFNSPPVTITQSISIPLTPTEPLPSATNFGFEPLTKEDRPEPRKGESNCDSDLNEAQTRRLSSVNRRVARLSCDLIMAPDDDKKQPQNARVHVQQPIQNPKQYLQHKRDSQFFEPIATPAGKHSGPFPILQEPSNGQTVGNLPPEVMALARELYDECGTAIKAMKVALEADYAGMLEGTPRDEVHTCKFSPLLADALLFLEDEEAIAAAVKRSSSLNSIPRIRHVASEDPLLPTAPNASCLSIVGIRGAEGYPTPRPALPHHLQRVASHSKFGASMLTSTEDLTRLEPIGSADFAITSIQEGQHRPLGTLKSVSSGSISPPTDDVKSLNAMPSAHDGCEFKNIFSTLRYALERDAFPLAELLLMTSNFSSEEVLARHPDNGETVLHLAVLAAQAQLVKLLLDVGKADPNAVAEIKARKGFYWARGTTPLHCVAVAAAGAGPKANAALCEIIDYLLPYTDCEENAKKANALNGNGHTALYLATSHFHDRVVIEELLSRGCDPNTPCPHFGFYNGSLEYPLQVASMHCKSDIGAQLLRYGANPDVADTFSQSVLLQQVTLLPSWQCNGVRHESNRVQGLPFIHALLRHGASISQKVDVSNYAASGVGCGADNFGRTALHLIASHDEYPDVASLLLSYGVDVEAADNDGRTALHVAAFEGCANMVRVLVLEGGANVKSVSNDGLMPRLHGRLISQLSGLAI